MRSILALSTLALTTAATMLCAAYAAQAATSLQHRIPAPLRTAYAGVDLRTDLRNGNGGFNTGPYRQGAPGDRLPIWRRGYYQGNDPDQFIRLQLMRDPRNYTH